MFSRRRSMNPPKLSTTSAVDKPLVPQDALPLRPGTNTTFDSISYSESHSTSPPKADPYRHHLQQSESKVRPVSSGTKYPPPIENKAQTPNRPRTSSHILDRVSSLFNSPSGKYNARPNETDNVVSNDTEDKDDRSSSSSIKKLKHMSKFIKPMSRNSPKQKRIPSPIITSSSSSSNLSVSSFIPFRSLTYSRSKFTQQILSTLSENSPAEPSRTSTTPCTTPRTPRSLWYNGESDEEDIRPPSGLGARASISSLPSSPYGERYPWEAVPELARELPLQIGNVHEGAPYNEEQGHLRGTFRFPKRSLNHVASDNAADHYLPGTAKLTITVHRPRALSSPAMTRSSRALLISKAREKLEMETEFQRLTAHSLSIKRSNGITKEQGGEDRWKEGLQEMKEVEDAEKEDTQVPFGRCEATKEVEWDENELGGMKRVQHLNGREENILSAAQRDGAEHSFVNQPHEAKQDQYDAERERDRMMSFSLVNMFPEPPSMHPSSDLAHKLTASSPPMPTAVPASITPPGSPSASKRFSSGTMASMASTATMTSLGANFSIINGPFSLHAISSLDSSPIHDHVNSTLSNGCPYRPPGSVSSPTSLFMVANLSTPAMTSTTLTFSFPPSPYPSPLDLPHEVLSLALSFLPDRKDLASVARVSKEYATAVRALLYNTINLNSLEEGVEDGPVRVRQLLCLLVKRNDLTALVTQFVCHEWPEWFLAPPYASQDELEEPSNVCCGESEELEDTFLSATLVLALSRMTGLREIVLPSYHPFLFASAKGLTWSGLKSVEFRNVTMDDEEAKEMFAWLEGMNGLERLFFPMLVEKTSSAKRVSNESIQPTVQIPKSPKRQKRCNSCLSSVPWNAKTGKMRDSTDISVRPMSFPVCDSEGTGGQGQGQETQQLPVWVHPLAKFVPSRTFLPKLKVLQATPTIISLLAASSPEHDDNLSRPLVDVTINIDMTLYTGLRPTALVQGFHDLKRLCLRFGERVDKRTVEKMLMSVGNGLGNGLKELQIELIGAWAAGSDETFYKILDTSLPRYPGLHRLNLRYPKEDDKQSSFPLTVVEKTRLGQWIKNCPQLERVELLSGSAWRRSSTILSFDTIPERMMLCSLL